jgi:hypothetical protein
MGDIREELIAKTMGLRQGKEQSITEVEQETHNMGVVEKTVETAKKLSGAGELVEQLDKKDQKIEALEKERKEQAEARHVAEIQNVRTELGTKMDHLEESIKRGASQKSIAEEIVEIKKAANELNLGGSRISELRDMMSLIQSLNPQKNLADQIKDAKDLLSTIQPPEKEKTIGIPPEIALELKKMDTTLQLELERMKDERQRKDQEFKLTLKKWDEERDMRREEIQGNITVQRERNKMFADGLRILGQAGGRAIADAAREGSGAGVSRSAGSGAAGAQGAQAPSYHVELGEGEAAKFECPHCKSPIAVASTSTLARCLGCNSTFPITRVAAPSPPAPVSTETQEE